MTYPNSKPALDYYIALLTSYRNGERGRRGITKEEAGEIEVLLRQARHAMVGDSRTEEESNDRRTAAMD